jgi:hypothetical protein
LRSLKTVDGHFLARRGIVLYHYSLLFPKQVIEKCQYYATADWSRRAKDQQWARETFLQLRHPYQVHNIHRLPSWLERYSGSHPPQIGALFKDIEEGRIAVKMRQTQDIEKLVDTRRYRLGRAVLKLLDPFSQSALCLWRRWRHWFQDVKAKLADSARFAD